MNTLSHGTGADPGAVADLLSRLGEREMWLRHMDASWRDGYAAGRASRADDYEAGFADGCMAHKRAQHDVHRLVQLETARWDGWRENFGDPRPGDFLGRGDEAA